MLESKVFANGSTTLPKLVCEALGVNTGDTVRFVISENGVHVEQAQSIHETADVLVRSGRS